MDELHIASPETLELIRTLYEAKYSPEIQFRPVNYKEESYKHSDNASLLSSTYWETETARETLFSFKPKEVLLANRLFWYLLSETFESDLVLSSDLIQSESLPANSIKEIERFVRSYQEASHFFLEYMHPWSLFEGEDIDGPELRKLIQLLHFESLDFKELQNRLEQNIDRTPSDLLIYHSLEDSSQYLAIDTFSSSEDQINPVMIYVKCKRDVFEQVDSILVNWRQRFRIQGPFVKMTPEEGLAKIRNHNRILQEM